MRYAALLILTVSVFAPARAADEPVVCQIAGQKLTYAALAPAGVEKPALVVYLHGGGEDDRWGRVRKDYWGALAKRGCVLIHPAGVSKRMWVAGEDKWILAAIGDARQRFGADPGKTVLLGVSGGGQMALYLADHYPDQFACVITHGANPIVVRGGKSEWFYPARSQVGKCSYFALNHITQGSALLTWRQVRHKAAGYGVRVNVLPVTGKVSHYLGAPPVVLAHLDAVLADKVPAVASDPQKAAVAKMFGTPVAELKALLGKPFATVKVPGGAAATKLGAPLNLTVAIPAGFTRKPEAELRRDASGKPLAQIKAESDLWPITLRAEARCTDKPRKAVVAAETAATVGRGMLYQQYHTQTLSIGRDRWDLVVGSMTYPDRKRGWVSVLFVSATTPHSPDRRQWLRVLLMDETQQPDAKELAGLLKVALTTARASAGTKGR